MNQFQIITPSQCLTPYVKQYWFTRFENMDMGSQRQFPVGCMGLNFFRREPLYSPLNQKHLPNAFISGQAKSYLDFSWKGCLDAITIVFQPAGAYALFKIPAEDFYNQQIAVDCLSDPPLKELENRLAETESMKACVTLIENFLIHRLQLSVNENFARISAVTKAIDSEQYEISNLAQTACLGYKQFKRIFTKSIGTSPKEFLRIIRFKKAMRIMQMHPLITLTQLAELCNYYDKSHLIKEFKELSGYTPSEYLMVQQMELACQDSNPYDFESEHFSLFRLAFSDR